MFTGLIEAIGVLRRLTSGPTARASIEADLGPLSLGESINVSGACLTVDQIAPRGFACDLSTETLSRTTLGALAPGARVHLERAVPLGGRMGGHMVLGHVDGIGRVIARERVGEAVRVAVSAPAELARLLATKGSVAVDGVSLTVNEMGTLDGEAVTFAVMLVPHTLGKTLLGELRPGAAVNLEVDVLARYVARQLEAFAITDPGEGETDEHVDPDHRLLEKLRAGGFT